MKKLKIFIEVETNEAEKLEEILKTRRNWILEDEHLCDGILAAVTKIDLYDMDDNEDLDKKLRVLSDVSSDCYAAQLKLEGDF